MQLVQLEAFKKEIAEFPIESREDILSLITRFLKGEQLNRNDFKTFKIDKSTRIQEFRVKDHRGNWRAISTIVQGQYLVFVYAFHKKSQELLEKDKDVIRARIKENFDMKTEKLKAQSLEEVAKDWGIDYQVFKIKSELINTIRKYCDDHEVSQRKLASLVPGLSQDRISKIFSGQVGHMTIDKLVEILSVLKFKVAFKAKAA